jgi:hypothetical protein
MAEHESEFEQDLRRVRQRLRAGLARRHPVTEKRLEAVREVVRRQWELKQQRAQEEARKPPLNRSQPHRQSERDKSKHKDYGHEH